MITIFSTPRPFKNHFDIIQRNAIKSWSLLRPHCQIILIDDEERTSAKVAEEFEIECISDVACNEFGTPLINDIFKKVYALAKYEIIAQVNTDIILLSDFIEAIKISVECMGQNPFYLSGQRWNLDIYEPIDTSDGNWGKVLVDKARDNGVLHAISGMDYWVFTKILSHNFITQLPPFVVGRPCFDTWLIWKMKSLKIPVIDGTGMLTVIHQNHPYRSKQNYYYEIEKRINQNLSTGYNNLPTLLCADWLLSKKGLRKPGFPRRLYTFTSFCVLLNTLISIKRSFRKRGLTA